MNKVIIGSLLLLILAGCADAEPKDVEMPVDEVEQVKKDFFVKLEEAIAEKYTIIEKVTMGAEMIGAVEGKKFIIADDNAAEVYLFDESSDAYKKAKDTGKLTLEGFGQFDIIMNGLYGILPDNANEDVIAIFKSIE